jgi:hypothetical protein
VCLLLLLMLLLPPHLQGGVPRQLPQHSTITATNHQRTLGRRLQDSTYHIVMTDHTYHTYHTCQINTQAPAGQQRCGIIGHMQEV